MRYLAPFPWSGPVCPRSEKGRCQKSKRPPAVGPAGISNTRGPVSLRFGNAIKMGSRGVRGQDSHLLIEVEISCESEGAGAVGLYMRPAPLGHLDHRQSPDIGLDTPLEVEFIIEFLDGRVGRVASLELQCTDACIHRTLERSTAGSWAAARLGSGFILNAYAAAQKGG